MIIIKKLVIFDMDGTLNQTERYAVEAFHKVFDDMGIHGVTDQQIIDQFGAISKDVLTLFLGKTPTEEQYQFYRNKLCEYEDELMLQYGAPYPGVPEMLDRLHQAGYTIAVCSNASLHHIEHVSHAIGITEKIDLMQPRIQSNPKSVSLKYLLDQEQPDWACMVGDRIFDLEAAKANHIPFVGCLYGFGPNELSKADIVVEHASEITQAIEQLQQ